MASRSYSKIDLPGYEPDNCTFFALGRNAMYAACRVLGLRPGDEVLTPAFDCDGSLQPFRVLGLEIRFFRSDPYTLSVDIADLKRRITTKTKLLHIINHFGMPQPWNHLLCLRQETGIPILEDNAYSLLSNYEGRHFGSFGDMAIFSLRKNLPLIDGGLLRINNPAYRFNSARKNDHWLCLQETDGLFNLVKTRLGYYKLPESFRRLLRTLRSRQEPPPPQPPPPLYSDSEEGYPDWSPRDSIGKDFSCDFLRPMSRPALLQLNRYSPWDYRQIATKKREYYSWLSEKLSHIKGLTILWPSLPGGAVPFCFSMLIESKRDMFLEALRGKYDVMAWPTLSKLVLDQLGSFPEVELLGRKLLQLNLLADKVRLVGYSEELEDFVQDVSDLSRRYLSNLMLSEALS